MNASAYSHTCHTLALSSTPHRENPEHRDRIDIMIPVKRESEPDQSIHYLLYANKAKENCIVTSPPPSKLGPPIAVQIVSIMMAVQLHVQAHAWDMITEWPV